MRRAAVAGAAAVALIAAVSAPAASSERRAYAFEVVWSIFPELTLARGTLTLDERDGRYVMGAEATAKLTTPRVDWRGYFATEGLISGDQRQPQRFERNSRRIDVEETVVVDWSDGGQPRTTEERRSSGADPEGARELVPASAVRDVIDPLTFLARMLDQVRETNGASCAMSGRTWDGERLAEIALETFDKVEAARIDCKVVYRSISGLRQGTPWRTREASTLRLIRFEKRLGRWEPVSLSIEGEFVGFRSSFTTVLRPLGS